MTAGVEVDVEDGSARFAFTDPATRGVLLGDLLAAVGAENVRSVTRPRKAYVVAEDVARAAGVLDVEFTSADVEPQGYDDGKPDMDWSRAAINEYAAKHGVDNPEALPNKQAVLDAIDAASTPSPTDEPNGASTGTPDANPVSTEGDSTSN